MRFGSGAGVGESLAAGVDVRLEVGDGAGVDGGGLTGVGDGVGVADSVERPGIFDEGVGLGAGLSSRDGMGVGVPIPPPPILDDIVIVTAPLFY